MPVKQLVQNRSAGYDELVESLAAEWKASQSRQSEPVILVENDREGRLVHVYVVWTKWDRIDRVERSEIIMGAAERVVPEKDVLNITIAMGLTPDEADQMGLQR